MGSLESTKDYWGPNHDTLPAVGATDRSFNYLFIGAASTIVILWFGIAGGWLARRGYRLMAGVLLVALLYALGRYTPLYALAFHYVPGVSLFRRPIDGAFVLVAAFALLAGQLIADYVREGVPRVARPGGWSRSRPARSASWPGPCCSRACPITTGRRLGGSQDRAGGAAGDRSAGARADAEARTVAAAAAWRRWRRASSSGAASPRASTPRLPPTTRCCRSPTVPMRRRSPCSSASSRQPAPERRVARASRSSASAAPGRTSPWRAGWRRPTATTPCASAPTTAWCRPARPPTSSTSGCSRPPSTATTARSRASSGSNTSCSDGRSRRCRTCAAGRSRTCCWRGRRCGSTGCAAPSRASSSSSA